MKNMKEKENENMKKKILALALAGVLVVGALTGCGSSKSESSDKKTDDKKITVAASATPHAEISSRMNWRCPSLRRISLW